MRKTVTLVLSFLICSIAYSQNAFYEAQQLTKISVLDLQHIQTAATPSTTTIRGVRVTGAPINLSAHEIMVVADYIRFLNNPFDNSTGSLTLDFDALQSAITKYNDHIKVQLTSVIPISPFLGGATTLMSLLIPMVTKGGGGLTPEQQTNILDGVTKYYAEEFKKARTLTYMQLFEASIGRVGELEVIFPETYSKLASADPARFPDLGHEYKTILNEDLKAAIDNITNHIDNHTASGNPILEARLTWLSAANVQGIRRHDVYPSAKIIMEVGSKLINGYHPADIFTYIDEKYYNPVFIGSNIRDDEKLKLIFHGVNLLQRNLLDTTKVKEGQFSDIWVSLQDLNDLNANEWVNFLGLIYQQDRAFFNPFFLSLTGTVSTPLTSSQITIAKRKLYEILAVLIELRDLRNQMQKESIEANFIKYMQFALRVIQTTNYFPAGSYTRFAQLMRIGDCSMNLYDNARKKDYSNTAYYIVRLVNEFMPAGSMATYTATIAEIDKYCSFGADIINAKNSDEVKDVIKKHVAPPTSFILKREFRITGSVTGHPGYFVGSEKLFGDKKAKFISGLTLPLGFEFTYKLRRTIDNSGSIGIFAQVLDLGAILNFRMDDETSTLPDKVEFAQVFSPGISLTYGFKNSPVSLAAGYQYTPELRKITLANGSIEYPNGDRIFVRLGWDIPMVNVFKSRNK